MEQIDPRHISIYPLDESDLIHITQRLGRDIRFKHMKFGRMLIEYIQFIILKMSREQLGIRFITLRKETVSMRLDIYTEMIDR